MAEDQQAETAGEAPPLLQQLWEAVGRTRRVWERGEVVDALQVEAVNELLEVANRTIPPVARAQESDRAANRILELEVKDLTEKVALRDGWIAGRDEKIKRLQEEITRGEYLLRAELEQRAAFQEKAEGLQSDVIAQAEIERQLKEEIAALMETVESVIGEKEAIITDLKDANTAFKERHLELCREVESLRRANVEYDERHVADRNEIQAVHAELAEVIIQRDALGRDLDFSRSNNDLLANKLLAERRRNDNITKQRDRYAGAAGRYADLLESTARTMLAFKASHSALLDGPEDES